MLGRVYKDNLVQDPALCDLQQIGFILNLKAEH